MSKNIVFCADGTWNGPGQDLEGNSVSTDPTNVLKLYHWLDGKDTLATLGLPGEGERVLRGADGKVIQIAKYLDGVGYNDNWLVKVLGGVFGSGIIARIVRGYTFISRNYEPGDRITIVGFSRGAYTARSLAGMILDVGLLDASKSNLEDKNNAYRLGSAMWKKHREHPRMKDAPHDIIGHAKQLLQDLPGFFSTPPVPADVINDVTIQTVAVWDTVGALGIPIYDKKDGRLDAFQFCDNELNKKVQLGLHAISNDEKRKDFTPSIWDKADNVIQARFRGAHADVGGGYPMQGESGLSDVALLWMQSHLSETLHFSSMPEGIAPNPESTIHRPWEQVPFSQLGTYVRDFSTRPDILVNP
jgi:uncharacterized protein (DUF2235 family)